MWGNAARAKCWMMEVFVTRRGNGNIDDISHLVDDDDEDVLGVKDEAFAGMRDSRRSRR